MCSKGALQKYINKQKDPLPEATILSALYQSCRALECAQEWNFIHCGLKPSNFLLSPSGTLKLSDYGLSHINTLAPLAKPRTKGRDTSDTVRCMSPGKGEKEELFSHKSDMWSLGATFYELITLKKAYPQ